MISSASEKPEWFLPPRQARSQQTLERILDAAEAIISEKGVNAVSIVEVTNRAKSSVGALYARFSDRERLLRSVFERFFERLVDTSIEVFNPEPWREKPFSELVLSAITVMLHIFNEQQGLIRGYAMYAVNNPELSALNERFGNVVAERATELIAHRQERITHKEPEKAVSFSVMLILSALEARALHGPELMQSIPDQQIANELTRMCLSYLGWSDGIRE